MCNLCYRCSLCSQHSRALPPIFITRAGKMIHGFIVVDVNVCTLHKVSMRQFVRIREWRLALPKCSCDRARRASHSIHSIICPAVFECKSANNRTSSNRAYQRLIHSHFSCTVTLAVVVVACVLFVLLSHSRFLCDF